MLLHLRPQALVATDEGRRVWRALQPLVERLGERASELDRLAVSIAPGEEYGALDSRVVVGEPNDAEPPILAREFERLLDRSDATRHATLIASPEFLLGSGGTLLGETGAPLRELFLNYAEEDWRAISLSLHIDADRLYWEFRVVGSSTTPELRRARRLVGMLAESSAELGTLVERRSWSSYAERLAAATPRMVATMARYTRRGAEDRQAVLNGYLPATAAHNLALAVEVLVAELSAPALPASVAEAKPTTVAERLRRPVTVVFERESLESALTAVANSTGVPIEIAGRDLQLEGVTRNQMLSLDLRDTPADAVLIELLRRANPDPLATGSTDERQRLVYVLRDDRLVVTTRAAAERRGEPLPAAFRPAP